MLLKYNNLKNISRTNNEAGLLVQSKLFDKKYYLKNNPDLKRAGIDPLLHFIKHGDMEYRSPSPDFNPYFYTYKNHLVREEIINPTNHFIESSEFKNNRRKYSTKEMIKYENIFIEEIINEINTFENLVIMESIEWENKLKQRPQHIARILAQKGIYVLYLSDNRESVMERIEDNLININKRFIDKDRISKINSNKYYWLFSTTNKNKNAIMQYKKLNIKIIYDYIDDINEDISGDVTNLLHNFNELTEIDPVILIASANRLKLQLEKKMPNKKILLCKNAVDLKDFDIEKAKNKKIIPEDIKKIIAEKKPIVGYYGAIAPWLDYELLNKISMEMKDINFVYIGVDYGGALRKLKIRKNVHFLGPKKYTELPYYSLNFSCGIIPFVRGDIAKSTSPVKLYEYMAMALPVVCTKDLLECYGFKGVMIAESYADFKDKLNYAIESKNNSKFYKDLLRQAEENSWYKVVDIIVGEIEHTSRMI